MYDPKDMPVPPAFDIARCYPEGLPPGVERKIQRMKDFPPELWQWAQSNYLGMVSHIDWCVGRLMQGLRDLGLADDTIIVYTSDHGDNVGARGVWGKSTLYQESVGVPMIAAGPGMAQGQVCETAVDLLDLYPTILLAAGVDPEPEMDGRPGRPLQQVAAAPVDLERAIVSEYHAAGSNTAAFMLRKGRWKYHHYVRFHPELFDLEADPEELHDLAGDPTYAAVLQQMETALRGICDPEAVDRLAKQDQKALIERHGGVEKASKMGSKGATPVPTAAPAEAPR